jgi:nucleotide-binding universal stress UspA family protein
MMENYAAIALEIEKAADRRLQELQKSFRIAGVATRIVRLTGAPVTQILAQARVHRADFIVMGSHGHTAFYDLLVGSTTHGVLLRAPCPVVIVPSATRKTVRAARSGARR